MSRPIVEVALRLTGSGFSPDDVTKLVGLKPTRTWRIGESIQNTQLTRKHDGWMFGIGQQETYDLDGFLVELFGIIEPYKNSILRAAEEFKLDREISFGIYVYDETPASWFSADTIQKVVAIGASLDLDLFLLGNNGIEDSGAG